MKKAQPILILLGIVVAGIVTATLVVALSNNYNNSHSTEEHQSTQELCNQSGQEIRLSIKDNVIMPQNTTAKKCDNLTITNYDDQEREMAFGEHSSHQSYNGTTEKILDKNQSFSVVLIKTGTYKIHDHNQDEVNTTITITN